MRNKPASPSEGSADFLYRTDQRFFATHSAGLEEWGADELHALGARDIRPGYRGFHFQADTRVHHNRATISLDLAGTSLHRRGYRVESVEAPMQETLAAGIMQASGWTGNRPLVDPCCGSGTLLCEAWMKACHIPAGYLRVSYAAQRLPDYDAALWRKVKGELDGRIHVPDGIDVHGSDPDPSAFRAARANLNQLPEGKRVALQCADFERLPGWNNAVLVVNPPYGVRIGDRNDAGTLLKRFGDFLKQRCAGCEAYILYGDDSLVKKLGLKPSWKKALNNGGLDGRLCGYELFAGPADAQPPRRTRP